MEISVCKGWVAKKVSTPLRVAIIGAGPAGIYAADLLSKAKAEVDLFEHLPAPFGLVRYGVAPDHPRIKQIVLALHKILEHGLVRLFCNVNYGVDISLSDLEKYYDAVVFATGTIKDAPTQLPGADLDGSYGAADFVSWYDGHPDVPRTWPLDAKEVAVIGAGNVALDVSRILAKHAEDLLTTDIPDNVYEGLAQSPITDVHLFARRGPAQAKFTPLELRELGEVRDVDIVVYPEDFEFDDGSLAAIEASNQTKQVVKTLTDWTLIDPATQHASRRIHLHFLKNPVAILGTDKVTGIKTEQMRLKGDGTVEGTGEYQEWPVQAVYRAIGYFGSPAADLPFDANHGVIPNVEGRVVGDDGVPLPRLYATGWIKRGPVGLIGSTKSDALETTKHLLADFADERPAPERDPDAIKKFLAERGVRFVDWAAFSQLDNHEIALGEAAGRERIKVVPRDEMVNIALKEKQNA